MEEEEIEQPVLEIKSPATEVEEGGDDADSPNSFLSKMAAKEAARLAARPNLEQFPTALGRDHMGRMTFLVKPGDKVIVERFATILPGRPWLDTKTYTVQSIDEASGDLKLWDDELTRFAQTNFIKGSAAGYRFCQPVKGVRVSHAKKRGRPRKIVVPSVASPSKSNLEQQPEEPKKRGRPKGSKNKVKVFNSATS